jgi:uncharacterized protein (DUF924 family)
MDKTILADIYRYWFGELDPVSGMPGKDRADMWFKQSDAVDAHIRENFAQYLERAKAADWNLAALSREEQVALLVLLDQFPRNIFRQSAEAFAYDAKAREIARALVGDWRRFRIFEQSFVILPFEHSEDAGDQDYSVMLFAEHTVDGPESGKAGLRASLDFATKHRDIIRKFGRFPHRNVMLGRESTPEEVEFLKAGRGF